MKSLKRSLLLNCCVGLMVCTAGFSQAKTASNFLVHMETTNEIVKLTCKEACEWKELSYTIKMKESQSINQFGMITPPGNVAEDSNFLFTIKKTKKGVKLEGLKGTAWKIGKLTCYQDQCLFSIDREGSRRIQQ